jgi:hypothetical protein
MSLRRRVLSTVTDTLTSGSHHIHRRLESFEDFKQPTEEPVSHEHACRRDIDHRHPRLHASAVSARPSARPSAVIIVPSTSGRLEFRIQTGMFLATAGRIVLG